PPGVFEVVVGPARELADGVCGEEVPADLLTGQLPGHVLDAVLADIEMQPGGVIRPRAPRAIEAPVLLVHHEQRLNSVDRRAPLLQHVPDASRRAPAGDRMVILMPGEVA